MAEIKQNVVVALFDSEKMGRNAIRAVFDAPAGEGYEVPEAALVAKGEDGITLIEGYEIEVEPDGVVTNGTIVGAVMGILGGPLGMLVGAGAGAFLARKFISESRASLVTEVARKLYDGEFALIALVSEDEPAFDAVLDGQGATAILRYDATDIADEVRLASEAQLDIARRSIGAVVAQSSHDIAEALQAQLASLRETVDAAIANIEVEAEKDAEAGKVDGTDGDETVEEVTEEVAEEGDAEDE